MGNKKDHSQRTLILFKNVAIRPNIARVLDQRVFEVSVKPDGLGRQIDNAKTVPKAKNITFGDLYDAQGKRIYLKEK